MTVLPWMGALVALMTSLGLTLGALHPATLAAYALAALWLSGFRYIPHNRIGVVEKLWSRRGSLQEGAILALHDEAGFKG